MVLIVGGIFGFLPILGFWMIPLGIGIVAIDVKLAMAALRRERKAPAPRSSRSDSE